MPTTALGSIRALLATAALVLMLQIPAARDAHAELRAGRIDAAAAARLPRGPDAAGGIGDWALSNGTLCAVVADPSHEGMLLPTGGSLVDLGFCDRDDDQFVAFEPLANLSRDSMPEWKTVESEVAQGEARIHVRGSWSGVAIQTTYVLDEHDPRRIGIYSRLTRQSDGERLFAFGDVTIHLDGTTRPFTLARRGFSEGFHHAATGDATVRELIGAIVPLRTVVLVGPDAAAEPISYGLSVIDAHLERASGEREALPIFGLSTETVTSVAAFVRPFWLGSGDTIGVLQLAQSLWMDLGRGDALSLEREIRVEPRLDAAAFTDRLYTQAPVVRGRVSEPSAQLHLTDPAKSAVSQIRPDPDGSFALRLPEGRYSVRASARARRSLTRDFEVGTEGLDLGLLRLPEAATLVIPPELAPARLAVRGEGETPNPTFGDDLLDFQIGGVPLPPQTAASDLHLGGFAGDPQRVPIAPGRYRVYATRGPEFSVAQESFEVAAGEAYTLRVAAPQRVVETPGWIAADLHVHAEPSDDTSVPLRRRLASFVAEGGEVVVATDHDMVTDYAPLVTELGLGDLLVSVVGLEVTSAVATPAAPKTAGHSNVFPLPYRPLEARHGALHSEGRRLRRIIADARALPGMRLVQLNHGREKNRGAIASEGAFLSHLSIGRSFAPGLPLQAETNHSLLETDPQTGFRDLDFDAMELFNGPSVERYRLLREDWLSLVRQGYPKTATSNSDTHSLYAVAAMPRSYVRMPDDAPAHFDETSFVESLRGAAAYGTTGPIVTARLGGADLGERFVGHQGELHVVVRAAEWVPVSQLRVYVNGELAHARTIAAPAEVKLPLEFERDAFVTLEVEGRPGALYTALLPDFTPFAFTNPIFVDADADGTWTPPGLAR